ncbi:hypothetical protein ACODM8_02265 [Vibrio ostreicida]|uniref:Uncharacterized protein n=1 Tax=Vibrio ostreicida TaxID=526588 RepID=A0ABT8BWY4_9VIBR|nr:hypothetical protein [Vibrio ostreicida]MDN3610583.1 hypothetical protein [Vibrio ostreicida]NPD07419.1 hypothetical protein [Vibrio ostreicida]
MTDNLPDTISQAMAHIEQSPMVKTLAQALVSQLEKQRGAINELLIAKEQGLLTAEEFHIELEREKYITESEMLSVQIATKAQLQHAINSAFNLLLNAAL